jgi:hypothetical protein
MRTYYIQYEFKGQRSEDIIKAPTYIKAIQVLADKIKNRSKTIELKIISVERLKLTY